MKNNLSWIYSVMIGIALLGIGIVFFIFNNSIDILINLLFSMILIVSGLRSLYAIKKDPVEDKKAKNTSYVHIIFTLVFGFSFLVFALTANTSMLSTMLVFIGIIIGLNGIGVLYEFFVYTRVANLYRLNLAIEGVVLIILAILAIAYRDSIKGVLQYIVAIVSIGGSVTYFVRAKVLYSRKKAKASYEVIN